MVLASAVLQGENDRSPSEDILETNGGKRPYTLFQGHSGPVHSATFSPLGDFILSSSADTTSMFKLPAYHTIVNIFSLVSFPFI